VRTAPVAPRKRTATSLPTHSRRRSHPMPAVRSPCSAARRPARRASPRTATTRRDPPSPSSRPSRAPASPCAWRGPVIRSPPPLRLSWAPSWLVAARQSASAQHREQGAWRLWARPSSSVQVLQTLLSWRISHSVIILQTHYCKHTTANTLLCHLLTMLSVCQSSLIHDATSPLPSR